LNTDFDCVTPLKKLDPPLPESTHLVPRKATMEDRAMNLLSRWLRRLPTAPSWIEPAPLAARLGRDAALLIIDVRGPDEFTGCLGHIRGATNIPLNELPAHLPDLVRENRPVVVVCKTDRRSSMAAQQLQKAGMSDVSVLRGGMEQWRVLGLPAS
jgi:rhodanese-related sulfurtransferase